MKKGILINVKNQTVTEILIGDDYRDIYPPLDCDTFDVVSIDSKNDLFVDDEGLLKLTQNTMFFSFEGAHQPFAGNGLILGINHKTGESTNTTLTVDAVTKKVKFHTLWEVQMMVN